MLCPYNKIMIHTPQQKNSLLLALGSWLVVIVLIRLIGQVKTVPFIFNNASTLNAALLLYVPIFIALIQKERLTFWDTSREKLILSLKFFVYASLAVFPAAFVVNHFYQTLILGLSYQTATHQAFGLSPTWILIQIVLIALPEEFFFRGFLTSAFEKALPSTRTFLGAPFGLNVVIVSLVFAFSHSIIHLAWWHGLIFFPALVFAWLKQRTGTIWASVFFHTACNCFAQWAFIHYS